MCFMMNFLLNQDQCRKSTAMTSKENNEKPVYSASNTLMIGDKPYKAYLNPVIFKTHFYNICFLFIQMLKFS
jgi:hypothetical protein